MAANWWENPSLVTGAQQKYYARSPAANGGMSVPMAPLPSTSMSQPTTPFPGVQNVHQGTADMPALVSTRPPGPTASVGGMGNTWNASMFGNAGQQAGNGPSGNWRGMAPTADVAAARSAQAIELSPEGYQLLRNSPELAQWLTDRSRLQSQANRERLGGMSEGMLGAVEYGNETPGYSPQYWNARTQRAKADSAAKFGVKRQIAADNLASGRWTQARYNREMANIQDESLQDIGNALGALDVERGQTGEQQRLARADRYLALMQAGPVQAQDWWSAEFGYGGKQQNQAGQRGGGNVMNVSERLRAGYGITPDQARTIALRKR